MSILSIVPLLIIIAVLLAFVVGFSRGLDVKAVLGGVVAIILVGSLLVPAIGLMDDKEDLDVFFVMGQSNAAPYRYDVSVAEPIPEEGMAYYYGTDSAIIYWGSANPNNPQYDTTFNSYGMHDMVNGSGAVIGNIDLPFAAEYVEQTGHKVYVINAAIPSASINLFQPNGIAWNFCDKVLEHAIAAASDYDLHFKGFIWVQGEQDYNMPVDEYKSKFLNFMDSFGELYPMPLALICKVKCSDPEGTSSGYNAVNSSLAQIQLAEENANIYLATSLADTFTQADGGLYPDGHYSQKGDNLLGVAIAQFYANNIVR